MLMLLLELTLNDAGGVECRRAYIYFGGIAMDNLLM